MSDINDSIRFNIMGKDENVMRVDVRVPMAMYERIEVLAEKTNQPFTPKTKNTANPKRIVTPIILKLVELGLKAIDEDSTKLDENLVSKDIDNSDSIEKRLFEKLEARLEELLAVKLEELKADTITPEDNSESTIEPNEINSENEYVKNLNAIEVKSEVVNEDVSALEDNESNFENEDNSEPNETPEVIKEDKTYEDAVNEIKKLTSQRLNNSKIAKKLVEGNYPTKRGSYNWAGHQVKRVLEESS